MEELEKEIEELERQIKEWKEMYDEKVEEVKNLEGYIKGALEYLSQA